MRLLYVQAVDLTKYDHTYQVLFNPAGIRYVAPVHSLTGMEGTEGLLLISLDTDKFMVRMSLNEFHAMVEGH